MHLASQTLIFNIQAFTSHHDLDVDACCMRTVVCMLSSGTCILLLFEFYFIFLLFIYILSIFEKVYNYMKFCVNS